jgi:tetratricopeptide (TPR) repeat protein
MAALAQAENRWGDALDWVDRGMDEFPSSAEMLLTAGSLEEAVGAISTPPERQKHFSRAHRSLRSAVAADPSLVEARLRLGHVAWRLGEMAEARSALEEVLAREPRGDAAFLAHLFLGRLDEDSGRLPEAARSYEAALAQDARSQSARLALSHVHLRLGDPGTARREVEAALGAVGRQPSFDPFRLYPRGRSLRAEDELEALRREASR